MNGVLDAVGGRLDAVDGVLDAVVDDGVPIGEDATPLLPVPPPLHTVITLPPTIAPTSRVVRPQRPSRPIIADDATDLVARPEERSLPPDVDRSCHTPGLRSL